MGQLKDTEEGRKSHLGIASLERGRGKCPTSHFNHLWRCLAFLCMASHLGSSRALLVQPQLVWKRHLLLEVKPEPILQQIPPGFGSSRLLLRLVPVALKVMLPPPCKSSLVNNEPSMLQPHPHLWHWAQKPHPKLIIDPLAPNLDLQHLVYPPLHLFLLLPHHHRHQKTKKEGHRMNPAWQGAGKENPVADFRRPIPRVKTLRRRNKVTPSGVLSGHQAAQMLLLLMLQLTTLLSPLRSSASLGMLPEPHHHLTPRMPKLPPLSLL